MEKYDYDIENDSLEIIRQKEVFNVLIKEMVKYQN